MKKIISLILSFFIVCLFFTFSLKVKATGTITTIDGASIRMTDPQGLRFIGEVSGEFTGTKVEYGFLLSRGNFSKEEMLTLASAGKAKFYGVGDELDENNRFYLAIINIPASSYEQKITVLACVKVDEEFTYSTSSTARNVKEVAVAAANDPLYVPNAYIDAIASSNVSTFNLNGGEFSPNESGVIGAYADGADGKKGITLGAYGVTASTPYFARVFLKTTETSNIYKVVRFVSGDGVTANSSFPHDYDYILAGYTSSDASLITRVGSYDFVYISSLAAGAKFKASNNYDLLLNSNFALANGNTLPAARKDYYTFNGWYDNSLFSGDPITTKDGDDSDTFYAKFTPNNFTLSYDLQSGECDGNDSLDDTIFTVESGAISLPIASRMTREDYTFVEWNTRADGSGDAITSIPAGSHANVTVYAIWEADLPVVVSMTTEERDLIRSIKPDRFVSNAFVAGKFTIDGTTYKVGESRVFSTISAAIAGANANDVIYVFAGIYTEGAVVSLNKAGIKIVGPNSGKYANNASPARASEANISNVKFSATASFTFDGLQLSGTTAVTSSSVNGITVKNCYINSRGQQLASNSEVLFFTSCQSIDLKYNYMDFSNSGRPIRSNGTVTNATISHNYIKSTTDVYDIVRITTIAGFFDFSNNYTEAKCSGWLLNNSHTGSSCANATITIKDNYFNGLNTTDYAGIAFKTANANTQIGIIGNTFNSIGGTNISIGASTTEAFITLQYNKFLVTTPTLSITAASKNILQGKNYTPSDYSNGGTVSIVKTNDFGDATALDTEYILSRFANLSTTEYLSVDETKQINIVDCDELSKSYVSSDTTVATVSDSGLITPLKVGSTNITVSISGKTAVTFTLNVTSIIYVDRDTVTPDATHVNTIEDALGIATPGQKIVVAAGEYPEDLDISVNYIKLVGPNYNKSGDSLSRLPSSEAIITGDISLDSNLIGVTIKGFEFTSTSKITNTKGSAGSAANPSVNIKDFNFSYNKVLSELKSGNGFIIFLEASSSYSHNLVFEYNLFDGTDQTTVAVIYLDNNCNLKVSNNVFKNITGSGVYVNDTTKGAAGDIVFEDNTFKTISGSAMWINWYSPIPCTLPSILVKGNNFEDIDCSVESADTVKACIQLRKCNARDVYRSIVVEENYFKDVKVSLYVYSGAVTKFTNNVVYSYYDAENGFVANSGSSSYKIDCARNLYLSTDGLTVSTVVYSTDGSTGFRFNSYTLNVDSSNYVSIDAYNAATGKNFSN